MFKHYLKLAFRGILRKKFYSSVIILSLTAGFTCTNYIIAFVVNEMTVDNFNINRDRIYRLQADDPFSEGSKMDYVRKGAPELITDRYPEVENYALKAGKKIDKTEIGQHVFYQPFHALAVSKSFFTIFSFPFLQGNPHHALDGKNDVVITKNTAEKLFGNRNAMGMSLRLFIKRDTLDCTVTGIIKEMKGHSHLNFDMLISLSNFNYDGSRAYLLLKPSTDVNKLEAKLSKDRKEIPIIFEGTPGTYTLQRLKDIYFDTGNSPVSEKSRSIRYVYISIVIGIIILIVAFLNYLNLLSAQLIDYRRKFGINRILGSSNRKLVSYILIEFGIQVFIAYDLSFLLTEFTFPYFNNLTGSVMNGDTLLNIFVILSYLIILLIIFGITFLRTFWFLKKQKINDWLSFSGLAAVKKRQVPLLVIFQFTISVVLLVCVITIARQLNFIYHKDLGISRNIVELRVPRVYHKKITIIKEEILKSPTVQAASVCSASPLLEHALVLLYYDKSDDTKSYTPAIFFGDKDYLKVLGIHLLKGREFSVERDAGKNRIIINKSLASMFNLKNPIGEKLPGADDEIIGEVADFNFQSLQQRIAPAYIIYKAADDLEGNGNNLLIRFRKGMQQEGIEYIRTVWDRLVPGYPFTWETTGDQFDRRHDGTAKFFRLIMTFLLISLILTISGLLALSIYYSRIRTREIGIRKVNGAATSDILLLLALDYIRWLGIALLLAFPVAWYFMDQWLQQFAYRKDLSWWIFLLAAIITIIVISITIIWQGLSVARRNPVDSLRYE